MKTAWKDFLNSIEYIPASWDRQKDGKEKTSPFNFTIKSLEVPFAGGKDEHDETSFRVCLGFFDTTYNQFFGRKWSGPNLPAKFDKNGKARIQYNQNVYFHTNLIDEAIVIALEVIRVIGSAETVVGWGIFRLFNFENDIIDCSSTESPDLHKLKMYHGSARALLFLEEPIENTSELEEVNGLAVSYFIRTHKEFDQCVHLVPHNFILGAGDIVPGLLDPEGGGDVGSSEAADPFRTPKLQATKLFQLEKIAIEFDPALMDFESELCSLLNQKFRRVEEPDRLQRDGRKPESDTGMVEVLERRLQIGVNNGWTYTDEVETVHLLSNNAMRRKSTRRGHQRTPSTGSSHGTDNPNILHAKNAVEIAMPEDMAFAIVFILEFVIGEPRTSEDRRLTQSMGPTGQRTVAIRYGVLCPFTQGQQKSGEAIEIELQGGPCRNPDAVVVFRQEKPDSDVTVRAKLKTFFRSKSDEPPEVPADKRSQESTSLRGRSPVPRARDRPPGESYISESVNRATYASAPEGIPPVYGGTTPLPHAAQMMWYQQMMASMPPAFPTFPGFTPDPSSGPGEHLRPMTMPPFINTPPVVPIGRLLPTGTGLSRASYARLYTAGFPQILDRSGEPPEVVDPSGPSMFDVRKEEGDNLQCNEIVFQFLAYARLWDEQFDGKEPRNVYFTFQFYRFPQFTTECLNLHEAISNLAVDQNCTPYILQKIDPSGTLSNGPPGYQIKYNVDPSFLKPGEGRLFVEHLSQQTLHIDVWDADSLLLVGSCAVELKSLCRQGREAVQVSYELEIVSASYSEEATAMTGDVTSGGSLRPIGARRELRGRLHLRLANIGYTTSSKAGKWGPATSKVFVSPKQRHLVESERMMFNGGSLTSQATKDPLGGSLKSAAKRVVRAKAAVSADRELAQLLVTRRGEDGVTNGHLDSPEAIDAERRRKLRRMEALRKSQPDLSTPDPKMLSVRAYRQDKSERLRDLKTIEVHRTQNKHLQILDMLSLAVSVDHVIYPSFGSTEFFEFQLRNPYNIEHTIMVQIDDNHDCLQLVSDTQELRTLKLAYGITTPIEADLISIDPSTGQAAIFVRPKESVLVPFKYVDKLADTNLPSVEGPLDKRRQAMMKSLAESQATPDERTVKINFVTSSKNQPIAKLNLRIAPQPPIIDQTFRFHQPEHSFFKKAIRLPPFQLPLHPANTAEQIYARCSDSSAICETRATSPGEPYDVFIKVPCGASPENRRFLVAIYLDRFLLRPAQIWQFFVHSQQRVDAVATEGQTTRLSLLLRGTHSTRQVRVFTSHPKEVGIEPSQPFVLAANAVHELHVALRPLRSHAARVFHVHVVDTEYHQMIRAWILCVQCKPPEITKAFELQLPVGGGQGSNKRISYSNPYPHRKTFTLVSSRPELLQFKESEIEVAAGETTSLSLRFTPNPLVGIQEIFVFMQDEEGKNEETFAISAHYT